MVRSRCPAVVSLLLVLLAVVALPVRAVETSADLLSASAHAKYDAGDFAQANGHDDLLDG